MRAEDLIDAVRASMRKYPSARPLATVQDAQREAAKAARAACRIIGPELSGMTSEERRQVIFETLRETNRAALEAAARMQRARAEAYGEQNLGIAEPAFDAQRARNLATYADTLYAEAEDGELTEEQEAGLRDNVENNARLCVDDAEREAEYQALEKKLITEDAAWIPMYAELHLWCLGDRVASFTPHWAGFSDFYAADVVLK